MWVSSISKQHTKIRGKAKREAKAKAHYLLLLLKCTTNIINGLFLTGHFAVERDN